MTGWLGVGGRLKKKVRSVCGMYIFEMMMRREI
jgi:hypothetical protein